MNQSDKEKILRAGKIVSDIRKYVPTIVKKGIPLIEIAEKIEARIVELGGKPAFPVNLSIDNIAAHYTPSHDDKTLASGLIKVDFGVHIDGWLADNSISMDLEESTENKKLIEVAEEALSEAIKLIQSKTESKTSINDKKSINDKNDLDINSSPGWVDGVALNKIGSAIQTTISSHGFNPVINLCGHSMDKYNLHAGITIPNIDNGDKQKLNPGLYAIEPFVTLGVGKVRDGKPSGIYALVNEKNTRSSISREVLSFIQEEYKTLPFCSRWIVKNLGLKALFGLRELESAGILHQFAQLVEVSGAKVSQEEHTILLEKDKVTVTTA